MRPDARTALTAALLAGAALLAPAACGATTSSDAAGTLTATTGPSSGAPTTPGARMTEGLAQPLVLQRGGGVAGLQDRVEVRPDGTYTVTSKGRAPVTRQLGEGQLAAVVHALADARLGELDAAAASPTRSDELAYTITADGQTYHVSETQAPASVRPLLEELGALFSAPASTP